MLLAHLSYGKINKCLIKYIYKGKVSTSLTDRRAQMWKNMKIGKHKPLPKLGLMYIRTLIEIEEYVLY